jgi:hypothetical protein
MMHLIAYYALIVYLSIVSSASLENADIGKYFSKCEIIGFDER